MITFLCLLCYANTCFLVCGVLARTIRVDSSLYKATSYFKNHLVVAYNGETLLNFASRIPPRTFLPLVLFFIISAICEISFGRLFLERWGLPKAPYERSLNSYFVIFVNFIFSKYFFHKRLLGIRRISRIKLWKNTTPYQFFGIGNHMF